MNGESAGGMPGGCLYYTQMRVFCRWKIEGGSEPAQNGVDAAGNVRYNRGQNRYETGCKLYKGLSIPLLCAQGRSFAEGFTE